MHIIRMYPTIFVYLDHYDKDKQSHLDVMDIIYHNQDWLDCTGSQAAIGVVHIGNNRRYFSVSNAKRKAYISGNIEYVNYIHIFILNTTYIRI